MTIYVELLNEGTDCWCPVEAKDLGNGRFQIVQVAPEGEEWAFLFGDIVNCRQQEFRNGTGLVAYKKSSLQS
jgi:hypothetical protein